MKQLISKNGGYKVYADLSEVGSNSNSYALKFFTEWADAHDKEQSQQKFIMFLTQEELQNFKNML